MGWLEDAVLRNIACFFKARLNIGITHTLMSGETVMVKRCLECGYDNSDTAEVCVSCGSALIEVASGKPGPPTVDVPPGSGAIRPGLDSLRIRGPPRAKVSFGLCLIATLLVTLNAVLAGLAGVSVPVPVWILPLTFSNIQADSVGLVVGFGMLIGSILILARREIYGSGFIIVLSLISLGIGGGFMIGFLLGIIGALLALLKK